MPVEITASGSDDVVLSQVATDGGSPVTHQGSTRNRIDQVAADAGLGDVPWLSDAGAIVWLAENLGGGISCVYTYDADLAEVQALNGDALLEMSGSVGAITTVDQQQAASRIERMAAPAGIVTGEAQMLPFTAGKRAVALVPVQAEMLEYIGGISVGMGLVSSNLANFAVAQIDIGRAEEGFGVSVSANAMVNGEPSGAAPVEIIDRVLMPVPTVVMVFDADAESVGFYVDGVLGATLPFPPAELAIYASMSQSNAVQGVDLGKVYQFRFATLAAEIPGAGLPPGVTDACGTEVAA